MKSSRFSVSAVVVLLIGIRSAFAANEQPPSTNSERDLGSSFQMYHHHACRDGNGDQGTKNKNIDLVFMPHDQCERECAVRGGWCFGYEYHSYKRWCELWTVPIDRSRIKSVGNYHCVIKIEESERDWDERVDGWKAATKMPTGPPTRSPTKRPVWQAGGQWRPATKEPTRQPTKRPAWEAGGRWRPATKEPTRRPTKRPIWEAGGRWTAATERPTRPPTKRPVWRAANDPAPKRYDFKLYSNKSCRTKSGRRGDAETRTLYKNRSWSWCKDTCLGFGYTCYGYAYHLEYGRCEIWRVPISTAHDPGFDCFVKYGEDV